MNKFDLNNKNAIITGGAQGFGLDIAKRFLQSGAKVIIWDTDEKELEKASKLINDQNLSCDVVDVSDPKSVDDVVNKISSKIKIDILINNAGITGSTAELWNYDYEEWKKIIDINLHGTFNCCKSVVPHMIKNNYGRIVNIASVSGKDGNAKASAYSSSKAGVIAFTAISYFANSFPRDLVRPITPALAELYALAFALPSFPATDAILTILP